MVELFGEDSRDRLGGIYTAQGVVGDRTGNGDDVGQGGIEDGRDHDGPGKSLDQTSWNGKFNVQLLPGPRAGGKRRLEISSPGASGDIASPNGVGHVPSRDWSFAVDNQKERTGGVCRTPPSLML